MRTYVKPVIEVVTLRVEERISGSEVICKVIGCCPDGKGGYLVTPDAVF
ncbi:MAG: hypothetical protein ACYDG2_06110 [Ruminiclostridium sp.]